MLVKLDIYCHAIYIIQFVDRSWTPVDFFSDLKYYGCDNVLCGLGKLHLLFSNAHVLSNAKLGRRDSIATFLGLHSTPYGKYVRFGHT